MSRPRVPRVGMLLLILYRPLGARGVLRDHGLESRPGTPPELARHRLDLVQVTVDLRTSDEGWRVAHRGLRPTGSRVTDWPFCGA